MNSTEILQVATDHGAARLLIDRASGSPRAVLALGHGAGGGPDALDLAILAERLPAYGIEVVRMEQPWRLAGKRIAPRPAVLDQAWCQALGTLSERSRSVEPSESSGPPGISRPDNVTGVVPPLIVGGRSAGARVACRTAGELDAIGCLSLAFPLHPPGRADDPDKDRSPELVGAGLPTLVLQGERDPFGEPDAVRDRVAAAGPAPGRGSRPSSRGSSSRGHGRQTSGIRVVPVPQAGHELTVSKRATITQSEVLELITASAAEWIEELIGGQVEGSDRK